MIRIERIWLATEPDGHARRHRDRPGPCGCGVRFDKAALRLPLANRRANRMKLLVHDSVGIWLAARRLNQGKFHWPGIHRGSEDELDTEQFQALVLGLPWQRMGSGATITAL